ncbi:MAG TPA: OmpA family protein [Agriterribacter sp.]|nr:OmpA family protein [Agriterribacter sp.]
MLKRRRFFLALITLNCLFIGTVKGQHFDTLFVHFEYNKSFITETARESIDSFFSTILRRAFIKGIALSGHCDSIGDNEYNDSLSVSRVLAVKEYLYSKGITDRILTGLKGWGKRQPFFDNNTDENRSFNRRVEIVLQSIPKTTAASSTQTEAPVETPSKSISDFIKDPATKAGDQLVLRNLHFIAGRHFPLQWSLPILNELAAVMKNNPTVHIEIQGHVCCERKGGDGYDADLGTHDLSIQRAKFVYDFLKSSGIDPDRMQYRGFGSSRKLFVDEVNEAQQTANRRVEIKVISK